MYRVFLCKQLKVQYNVKPPSELLGEIKKLVSKYPGVELAPVEFESGYTSCRPSIPQAPPQKKLKKGYPGQRQT